MDSLGKILMVEDDKFTGRMMELQFSKCGYEITVVCDGLEALEQLANHSFDVVISDVMMPQLSGIELLRKIRESYPKDVLPVILYTAEDNSPRLNEALSLGVNDFFTKPREFNLTLCRVATQIELKQARNNLSTPLVRSGQDALWSWNIGKGNANFSAQWKQMLQLSNAPLTGTIEDWFQRIHPEDRAGVDEAMSAHQERKTAWFEQDFRMKTGTDQWLWIHAFGVILFGKDGPVRMLGSFSRLKEKDWAQTCELLKQWRRVCDSLPTDGLHDHLTEFDRIMDGS